MANLKSAARAMPTSCTNWLTTSEEHSRSKSFFKSATESIARSCPVVDVAIAVTSSGSRVSEVIPPTSVCETETNSRPGGSRHARHRWSFVVPILERATYTKVALSPATVASVGEIPKDNRLVEPLTTRKLPRYILRRSVL